MTKTCVSCNALTKCTCQMCNKPYCENCQSKFAICFECGLYTPEHDLPENNEEEE